MSESDTPPERILRGEPTKEAVDERERILRKARQLLDLAAAYLAAKYQSPNQKKTHIKVETGHIIQAAEIVFVAEEERLFPWLSAHLKEHLPFHSCFLSYSTEDKRFCDRLHGDLLAEGVPCWYFREDADWGEPVWDEIKRAIDRCDKLVVVCSRHSFSSGPVFAEIERALSREDAESKNILFPITISNFLYRDCKHFRKQRLLDKVVGDFRGWNRSHAKYDAAFRQLLTSLQAERSSDRIHAV